MAALCVLPASVLAATAPAAAEAGAPQSFVRNQQTWYAYVGAGESLSTDFTTAREITGASGTWDPAIVVTRPDGTVADRCEIPAGSPTGTSCAFGATADAAGVWAVSIQAPPGETTYTGRQSMTWDVSVGAGGRPVPGRVWTERFLLNDTPTHAVGGPLDMSLWYLTEQGYQYRVDRLGMNGIDSIYAANAFGVVDPETCASAHSSSARGGLITNTDCDFTPYKIFFDLPAPDLPASVALPGAGQTWLLRPPLNPSIDGVTFEQAGPGSRAGTVDVRAHDFEGTARLLVDADGDGVFDGPGDRTLSMAVVAGHGSVAFDGLDGTGAAIPVTTPIQFRIVIDGFAEVHFTDGDVETLPGGIRVERLNGPDDGTRSRIFWDDSVLTSTAADPQAELKCSTTPVLASGAAGIDSSAGVHGWGLGDCLWSGNPPANPVAANTDYGGTWGNNRTIDNWATIDVALQETVVLPAAEPGVHMAKSSDPAPATTVAAGDVITYTLAYANSGDAPGVVDSTDDLSAVLDDADLTGAPVSDTAGVSVTVRGEGLRVTGTLAPGATAHVTYAVTVKADGARGDGLLDNVLLPDDPYACTPGDCETDHPVGALVTSKSVDPASGTTVPAGGVLTYTLRFANVGQVPVAVDHEDVLTGLLDDAEIVAAPTSSTPDLTVGAVEGDRFAVTGTLAPAASATVTYQARVKPDGQRGDDTVANVLVEAGEEPVCREDRTNCTENYVSPVTVVKSSDPATGTEVTPGQKVTYTLTFANTSKAAGSAPAAVAYTDHLAGVLDDAVLEGAPMASSGAVTGRVEGDRLVVTGDLAAGQSVTVRYTVTVRPYAEQGDHDLLNVVAPTGREPICVAGNGLCTEHPVVERSLAWTGANILVAAGVAVVAVIVGVGLALLARRRRGTTA